MKKKNLIKKCAFAIIVAILILIVILVMLRYEVEGEQQLPYKLSKILMISTVDGEFVDDPGHIWNINVTQTNDVYVYIEPDGETDETIKEITLQNFRLIKPPQKGEVAIYRPTGELDNLYTYSEQNYLNDKIVYTGEKIDDMKSLEIANNGGILGFRLSLNELGTFLSDEAEEITYDGRLLSNLGINLEEIELQLGFEMIITTNSNVSYKASLSMDMPTKEIIEKGSSDIEITDFSNVIFKRIQTK